MLARENTTRCWSRLTQAITTPDISFIGRDKMILLGRILPITEAFGQQDLQTALGRSGLSLISTTVCIALPSCLYQYRETDPRP